MVLPSCPIPLSPIHLQSEYAAMHHISVNIYKLENWLFWQPASIVILLVSQWWLRWYVIPVKVMCAFMSHWRIIDQSAHRFLLFVMVLILTQFLNCWRLHRWFGLRSSSFLLYWVRILLTLPLADFFAIPLSVPTFANAFLVSLFHL